MHSSGDEPELIKIGQITRPHGIRGEVRAMLDMVNPEIIVAYEELFVGQDKENTRQAATVLSIRLHSHTAIIRFVDCESRTEAEALVGMSLWIQTKNLPAPGQGEFYLYTLEGKVAQTTEGQIVGRIVGILETGGQPVLVIQKNHQELFIPAVGDFIANIGAEVVEFNLPPGLLEINAKEN